MDKTLRRHREIWKKKPLLKKIYWDWYLMIHKDMKPGKTVELGSGTGNFKEFMPTAMTTDIDPQPWLDKVFDAHKTPFKSGTISNLVMVDVLHHLADPISFFVEAGRVLKKGGRVIMVEPYPSWVSKIVYGLFHPEPFDFGVDYFAKKKGVTKTAWESNQAIPYLIFFKQFNKFENRFGNVFRVVKREKFSFITYPLSGGFENRQMYPTEAKSFLDAIENWLKPFGNWLAFRCYVVLEKKK